MNRIIQNFEKLRKDKYNISEIRNTTRHIIQIGAATCELATGSNAVKLILEKTIAAAGRDDIQIRQTGCTGRCSQEPIITIHSPNYYPVKYCRVDAQKAQDIFIKHFVENKIATNDLLENRIEDFYEKVIVVAASEHCKSKMTGMLFEKIQHKIKEFAIFPDKVKVIKAGNINYGKSKEDKDSFLLYILPDDVCYAFSDEDELTDVVSMYFLSESVSDKYSIKLPRTTLNALKYFGDVDFFTRQSRIALRNCGIIDPESISDYFKTQGFTAFANVLVDNNPDAVIDEIIKSGLRGRGGGGFPTGVKWKATRAAEGDIKYIVCNADEGDPGAFMDRSLLEGDPFNIIEGMLIAAFAIGASKGFFYVRAEYPLAIERIERAIKIARECNLLGNNILDSDFSFDMEIRLGAGAFVCGEETALLASIEGMRGQPRLRPPYPAVSGLWGKPTCINNVETWANIPSIILNGADWFAKLGTENSKGTKVFALAGKVRNTGLIEVPMGTTLRDVVFEIGGGIPNGNKFKAVQTGGPSGGCIPMDRLDTPIDYENLKSIGSMMGSGGMIVLDDTDCIVSTAKFFLEFTKDESCGKCTPCREGTLRMLEILERITESKGEPDDIMKLERLAKSIQKTALCGLGQTAPNPVLSAINNFREEFEAHVYGKQCPTLRCKKLITYTIDEHVCNGCTVCARRCPVSAIKGFAKKPHEIMQDRCIQCGDCYSACKFNAISRR